MKPWPGQASVRQQALGTIFTEVYRPQQIRDIGALRNRLEAIIDSKSVKLACSLVTWLVPLAVYLLDHHEST